MANLSRSTGRATRTLLRRTKRAGVHSTDMQGDTRNPEEEILYRCGFEQKFILGPPMEARRDFTAGA